jgi:hypothetical protein
MAIRLVHVPSLNVVKPALLLVEAENGEEGGINPPLFFGCEVPSEISQSAEIHSPYVLDQDPCLNVLNFDLRSERGRSRTGGGGCDQNN